MRKSGTHSARALGKKSRGRRGGHKQDARAPMIALCALGVGILAATAYGFTHRPMPTSTNVQASGIAAPSDKEAASTVSAGAPIKEQALKKEDRLVTGSIPKPGEAAPPPADAQAKPQAEKKKKAVTAKVEAPKTFFDYFNIGQNTGQPKR